MTTVGVELANLTQQAGYLRKTCEHHPSKIFFSGNFQTEGHKLSLFLVQDNSERNEACSAWQELSIHLNYNKRGYYLGFCSL